MVIRLGSLFLTLPLLHEMSISSGGMGFTGISIE